MVWGGVPVERIATHLPPYRIHALAAGHGGPAVVLLHGLSGSGRWWRRNVPGLAAEFRLLIPDVIGFGRSRCPGRMPSFAELADILCRWLRHLGHERVHLVGHSMGGEIAVHLAVRYPALVQRLVLAAPAGIPRPLTPRQAVRSAAQLVPPRVWGDPWFFPVILGDALAAGPRTILQALGHILRDDVRPLLDRIQAPTLVVWGERDTLVPVEQATEFRDRIPNARLALLRGAAHNVMVDRPQAFNTLVARFLRGEPDPPSAERGEGEHGDEQFPSPPRVGADSRGGRKS